MDRHPYSVPYQLIHETVEARYTASIVEVYYKGRRVTSHRRRYDHKPSTLSEHMPSAHRAHAEWTPSRLISWAEKTGPKTGRLVEEIMKRWAASGTGVPGLPGIDESSGPRLTGCTLFGSFHEPDRHTAASATPSEFLPHRDFRSNGHYFPHIMIRNGTTPTVTLIVTAYTRCHISSTQRDGTSLIRRSTG